MKNLITLIIFLTTLASLNAQEFKFVIWGDSQFQNPETFKKIVEETELLKPDLVIHVGDMIHGYTYDINNARRQWKRFKKQISPLTSPFYPTPGNHDVTTKEIQPAYIETWGEDKLYYSFDHKNSHFIVLNSFFNQQFNEIPEVEIEWLKNDLENAKHSENIFISLHSPLYLNKKSGWDSIHSILKKYPVRAVFSGHYHIYDYRLLDNIAYINLNSSGNMRDNNHHLVGASHHFLFVSVRENEVYYAVITDGRIYPPDAVDPNERNRASKYFESNKTIIIPQINNSDLDTTIQIKIENNADEVLEFILTWQTNNYNWSFEPWGKNITLSSASDTTINFNLHTPKGIYLRNEFPKLEVKSFYRTLKEKIIENKYYFQLYTPPITYAYNFSGSIQIDGKIDEEIWGETEGIKNLYIDTNNNRAEEKTEIKIIYDEENIYVAIKGDEPNPLGLASTAYGEIPLVFGDDDFEIYFDTNRDLKSFFRMMVNPDGTILSSGPDGRFTFDFMVETYIGVNYWSAEFAIPFKELKTQKPKFGDIWGFNIRRHRQQDAVVQSDWSRMREHPPYQPEYFGILKFK